MAAKKKAPQKVTAMGIEVTIDPEVLDDIELIDLLDDVQEGDALKVGKVLKRILGDQWEHAYDRLRNKRGVVPASKATKFFVQVMGQVGAKN